MKNRFKKWIAENIIADDPRSAQEQIDDENDPCRSPWALIVIVIISAISYGMLFYLFISNLQ